MTDPTIQSDPKPGVGRKHPGCDTCGRQPGPWFAPSPEWNLVIGGPEAKWDPGGMLCASCYLDLAYQVYPDESFEVRVQNGDDRALQGELYDLRAELEAMSVEPQRHGRLMTMEYAARAVENRKRAERAEAEVERMRPVVDAAVRYDEADDDCGENDRIGNLNVSMRLAELVETIIEYRAGASDVG